MYFKFIILLLVVGLAQCGYLNHGSNYNYGGNYGSLNYGTPNYGSSNYGTPNYRGNGGYATSSINRHDTTSAHRIFGVTRSYHYGTFNPRNSAGYGVNSGFGNGNTNGGQPSSSLYNSFITSNRYGTANGGFSSGFNGLNQGNNGFTNSYGSNTYGYGANNNNGGGQSGGSYRSGGN